MRMSREAKAQSKTRILNAASKMVRERGIDAASVAEVMQAAGMTNGGFYRHFQSKEEMVALAIRAAFDEIADRFDKRLEQSGAAAAIEAYVGEYLSKRHLEHPSHGRGRRYRCGALPWRVLRGIHCRHRKVDPALVRRGRRHRRCIGARQSHPPPIDACWRGGDGKSGWTRRLRGRDHCRLHR